MSWLDWQLGTLGLLLTIWWFLAVWHQLWQVYSPRAVAQFSLAVWAGEVLAVLLAVHKHWLGIIGPSFILLVLWQVWRRRWLFWEFWEKINPVLLGGWGLVLAWFNWQPRLWCPRALIGWWLAVCLSNFYWRRYRSFFWYPSGKIGFLPVMDLLLLSLGSGGVAIWQHCQLGIYLAGITLASSAITLYLLSGRKIGNIGL